jgi:uncharacterized protein HemY
MIEVHTWIFVAIILGLIVAVVMLQLKQKEVDKLKKKIKDWESHSRPG